MAFSLVSMENEIMSHLNLHFILTHPVPRVLGALPLSRERGAERPLCGRRAEYY